jgi:foldase protein PrsA
MIQILKRQWFIVLVAVTLLATLIFYVYDTNKDNLPGRRVNGKDVVFSVGDVNVTTDEFFEKLFAQFGIDAVYMFFDRAVVNAAIADSNVFVTKAEVDAQGVIANFREFYGPSYETNLLDALRALGYTSLNNLQDYFVYVYKRQELFNAYVDTNLDTLFPNFNAERRPRIVSHVLIRMDDPFNPTADEQARLDAAKQALADGMSFADLARNFSDDTSNNLRGGSLGYVDAQTQFVPEFLIAALATPAGELSAWTQTSFGFHLISVDSTDVEDFKAYQEFYEAILNQDPQLQARILWQAAEDLGVDFFGNDDLKAQLKTYMGIED